MNERIRELAEHAGLEFDDDLTLESEPIYYVTQIDVYKFAELIVADVINKAERYGLGCDAVEQLKEDFGVEG